MTGVIVTSSSCSGTSLTFSMPRQPKVSADDTALARGGREICRAAGYASVSADQQDLTAQRDGLQALGVATERIYVGEVARFLRAMSSVAMVSSSARRPTRPAIRSGGQDDVALAPGNVIAARLLRSSRPLRRLI